MTRLTVEELEFIATVFLLYRERMAKYGESQQTLCAQLQALADKLTVMRNELMQ